jgi:hypothetical protein
MDGAPRPLLESLEESWAHVRACSGRASMGMPGAARALSRPPRWLVQGVLMRPLGIGQATTKGRWWSWHWMPRQSNQSGRASRIESSHWCLRPAVIWWTPQYGPGAEIPHLQRVLPKLRYTTQLFVMRRTRWCLEGDRRHDDTSTMHNCTKVDRFGTYISHIGHVLQIDRVHNTKITG